MKIETSKIENMSAQTEFSLKQEHTSSFTKQLIQSKLDIKDEIRKESMVRFETVKLERVLLSSEKQMSHEDRIKKSILETLFQNFNDDKDFKLEPSKDNEKSDSHLIQIEESNFYHKKEFYQKSSIEFSTQAQIKTNRGQINIDLDISFSQEFTKVYESSYTSKKIIYLDPLIINYDSNLTSFDNISSHMKFVFDLNSDGKNELIPELKKGAGFLALDKNSDGKINDGNELFGTKSGDGFADLKAFDEDGNSWIDENDSIFSKLLIWEKNEEGNDSLIALGQAGIGAIYLSSVDSVYTYAKDIREEYAKLKQTSFFIKEYGKVGLITGVDFVTEELV